MNKILVYLLFFTLLVLSFEVVEARSGCCSSHGGVCGCRCCDGTSLSAKCAPYYPSCIKNSTIEPTIPEATTTITEPTPTITVSATIIPVATTTRTPTPTIIPISTPKPSPEFGIVADMMVFISAIYIIRKI